MRYRDLTEGPQDDIARSEQAQRATRIVTHAIYGGAKPDFHVQFADHGEFLLYGADTLGLAAEFPAFDGLCLAFGLKDPNAVGFSGRVGRFANEKLFDRYDRCIFFHCLAKISAADVRSATNSTAFLSISNHEFMHLLDAERTDGRIMKGVSNAKDKAGYYNDPAEFNAYFHDVADALTYIGSAPQRGESAADYADLYGLTGDFARDVAKMLKKDVYTSAFVKWLRDDRRKALLKRLYKLHSHVAAMIRADKTQVTESRARTLYHGTLIDFVPDILKNGLKPQVGALTTKWYSDRDVAMKPYVFAADARGLEKCVNVIAKQLRIKYGEDADLGGIFEKEAALLIIREGTDRHGFGMTPWENENFMQSHYGLPVDQYDKAWKRAPKTSEPGDYWTRKKVKVDAVLTGQRLMDFLRRQPSIWLWTWEDIDPGIMLSIARPRVIAALVQEIGPQAKDTIIQTVARLEPELVLNAIGGHGKDANLASAIPELVDLINAKMAAEENRRRPSA